jgi:hypothetical protein
VVVEVVVFRALELRLVEAVQVHLVNQAHNLKEPMELPTQAVVVAAAPIIYLRQLHKHQAALA